MADDPQLKPEATPEAAAQTPAKRKPRRKTPAEEVVAVPAAAEEPPAPTKPAARRKATPAQGGVAADVAPAEAKSKPRRGDQAEATPAARSRKPRGAPAAGDTAPAGQDPPAPAKRKPRAKARAAEAPDQNTAAAHPSEAPPEPAKRKPRPAPTPAAGAGLRGQPIDSLQLLQQQLTGRRRTAAGQAARSSSLLRRRRLHVRSALTGPHRPPSANQKRPLLSANAAPRAPRLRWLPRPRFARPVALLAALCVCAALAGGALLYRARRAAPAAPAAPTLAGALPIAVTKAAQVGDSITVTIGPAAAADGLPATLTTIGSYGPRVYHAAFAGGVARFLIPSDDTRQSGALTLVASAGAARGSAEVALAPGAPVEPLTPLVGPRSIVADTRHWSMVVVAPFDRFGNPVADGTPVDIRALHPGDKLELQHAHVRNLVAWARIYSGTNAGRTSVSVTSEGKYGPDATFMEVPDWPARFNISASPADVPADGRQFVTLRTDVIRDRSGNVLLDGTLVTFVAEAPGGEPRMIPAYTVDGVAKAQLQAPRQPGRLTVRAEVYNAESRPLEIAFAAGPAVNDFPIATHVDAPKQSIELTAGPMLGPLQQFIPDGTPVQFVLTDAAGRKTRVDTISERGYAVAVARLAFLEVGNYTAEATVGAGSGKAAFHVP